MNSVPESVKADIRFAHDQVRAFAKAQRCSIRNVKAISPAGVWLEKKIISVDSAGCYVSGGRFPHACSALTSIGTAKAAGVSFVVAASPPRGDSIDPAVCYAMDLAGADVILEMGGVQAVSSMAYGLFISSPANILAGLGNSYVAEGKALLCSSGRCGIDVFAGPTDICIVADASADPMSVAIELVSQAEHGYDSPVWLLTTSRELGMKALDLVLKLIEAMPAPEVLHASWGDYYEIVFCRSNAEICELTTTYAPEHLKLMTEDNAWWSENLPAYGSLFIGDMSTVPQGDKCSGTNHILHTRRAAIISGGLGVHKFLKIVTYQEVPVEAVKIVSGAASAFRALRVWKGMPGHATGDGQNFFPTKHGISLYTYTPAINHALHSQPAKGEDIC